MILDGGAIRGGFEAEYEARIVAPQDSAMVAAIARSTGTDLEPKVDVEIQPTAGTRWVFSARGVAERANVLTTPNPRVACITVDGGAYLVDSSTRQAVYLNLNPVECAASDLPGRRLFLATNVDVIALDAKSVLWQSRRISLDGVKLLTYANGYVNGVGLDVGDTPLPFSIDAETGEASGGFTGFKIFPIG